MKRGRAGGREVAPGNCTVATPGSHVLVAPETLRGFLAVVRAADDGAVFDGWSMATRLEIEREVADVSLAQIAALGILVAGRIWECESPGCGATEDVSRDECPSCGTPKPEKPREEVVYRIAPAWKRGAPLPSDLLDVALADFTGWPGEDHQVLQHVLAQLLVAREVRELRRVGEQLANAVGKLADDGITTRRQS